MTAFTQTRWNEVCHAAGLTDNVAPYFERMAFAYSEPHRRYHTAEHIGECLQEFEQSRHLAANLAAVELALWFHDVVYDPKAQDNEERSAALGQQWLEKLGAGKRLIAQFCRLVLATKHHDAAADSDAPLMVDIDLSILGKPAERFAAFETQIREEYAFVQENVFAAKRAEILQDFLDRERLYTTDWFYAKYEAQARRNLKQSIERLARNQRTTDAHR